jgi:hypothetical protein
MTPTRDPLRDARATRARLDYVQWDAALGLVAMFVGLLIAVVAVLT